MDGFQSPGVSIVAATSPSTLNNGSQLKAPAQQSDLEKLVKEMHQTNQILLQQHTNFRSEADRKIQDLTQRNHLLNSELQKSLAQNAEQPKPGSSPVDNLWNGFLGATQTQQTQQASNEPVTADAVAKIVQDTISKNQQVAEEINLNNQEIEKAVFQKFVTEHPDLFQTRRNEVLALWQGAVQANPGFAYNPAARYDYVIKQARTLYPKRDGASLGGESVPAQGGGTGVQQRKGGNATFEAMAQTEAEKEAKRFQDMQEYIAKRKRQFGERTGFPYGELE